ncbi:MAG TPA: hypothetical protein VGH25_08010 [Dongiaceae bacterium]
MILTSRTRAAQLFTVVAVAASAWGLIDPRPYPLAIGLLAILPWLAILISAHWRRNPEEPEDNASRPDLLLPLMLPGCILGLRAVLDVQVLVGWLPFLPAAVIAVLMTLVIRRAQSERQIALWLYLLIFIPVMGFYGYGSTVLANKILDQAPPKTYLTIVYDRSVNKISRHIERDLRLGPWGPRKAAANVEVPRRVFDAVRVDDSVCVLLHPGAFRIAWFEVEPCG